MTNNNVVKKVRRVLGRAENAIRAARGKGEQWIAQGKQGHLTVEVTEGPQKPTKDAMRSAGQRLERGKGAPGACLFTDGATAWLWRNAFCDGGQGKNPVETDLDSALEACQRALEEKTPKKQVAKLTEEAGKLEATIRGIVNRGLVTEHVLRCAAADDTGRGCAKPIGGQPKKWLEGLGWEVEEKSRDELVLYAGHHPRVVAVVVDDTQAWSSEQDQWERHTAVQRALEQGEEYATEQAWIIRGEVVRAYGTGAPAGRSHADRERAWLECHVPQMAAEGVLGPKCILGPSDQHEPGRIGQWMVQTRERGAELEEELRRRITGKVMPKLCEALEAGETLEEGEEKASPERLYGQALVVLFRVLFIAYGEDRKLLPYDANDRYNASSLKRMAQDMLARRYEEPEGATLWEGLNVLWRGIDQGNQSLGLPRYNGGLFSGGVHGSGTLDQAQKDLDLRARPKDRALSEALKPLLTGAEEGPDGRYEVPTDFAIVSVRALGTIYEGLLQQKLVRAEQDLSMVGKGKGGLAPTKSGQKPDVRRDALYMSATGQDQKETASYYTPEVLVGALLDDALDPALDRLERQVESMEATEAEAAIREFRVIDLAMGSGHFTKECLERMVGRVRKILRERHRAGRPLQGLEEEVDSLKRSAESMLQRHEVEMEVSREACLRRMVATRCIFGVDRNPLAVELARTAMWMETFVPGLPLSYLGGQYVHGNAVLGAGSWEEAKRWMDEENGDGPTDLFALDADDAIAQAQGAVERYEHLLERDAADVKAREEAFEEARMALEPTRYLMDMLLARRIARGKHRTDRTADEEAVLAYDIHGWNRSSQEKEQDNAVLAAETMLGGTDVMHYPVGLPQVYGTGNHGFDVVVGNPPWEEITLDEDKWWAREQPGLTGLPEKEKAEAIRKLMRERPELGIALKHGKSVAQRERRIAKAMAMPTMRKGDPDLYKAFAWRYVTQTKPDGTIGVVLPGTALTGQGNGPMREAIAREGLSAEVTSLENTGGWAFENVHKQKMIVLLVARRGEKSTRWSSQGPYRCQRTFEERNKGGKAGITTKELEKWTGDWCVPRVRSEKDANVMRQMKTHPQLAGGRNDEWDVAFHNELHATKDKKNGSFRVDVHSGQQAGEWPVLKGENVNLWTWNVAGTAPYGYGNAKELTKKLLEKREKGAKSGRGAFKGMTEREAKEKSTLACRKPRIVIRDITNSVDSRTIWIALIPGERFCTNQLQTMVWRKGGAKQEAWMLGILSSMALDWYARRWVATHASMFVLEHFPIPRTEGRKRLENEVVTRAARLATQEDGPGFRNWLAEAGVEQRTMDADEQREAIVELDALACIAYGLDEEQIRHIYDTFHHRPTEHTARRDEVLAATARFRKEGVQ